MTGLLRLDHIGCRCILDPELLLPLRRDAHARVQPCSMVCWTYQRRTDGALTFSMRMTWWYHGQLAASCCKINRGGVGVCSQGVASHAAWSALNFVLAAAFCASQLAKRALTDSAKGSSTGCCS